MKNIIILLSVLTILVMSNGCSGTWEGIKNDSSQAWQSTKETVHEATR